MKQDCPSKGYNREPKTKSGSKDKEQRCYKCTGFGHYSRQCPSKGNHSENSKWSKTKEE